jgi:hypothetical protein
MATCLILGRFSPEASGDPEEFEKLTDEQEEEEDDEDEEEEEEKEKQEEEEEEEEDGEGNVSGNKAQAHIQGKPSSPRCFAVNFFLDFVPP